MPRPVPVWEQSPLTDPVFADNPLAPEYEAFLERRGHLHKGKKTAGLYRDTFAQFSAWLVGCGQPDSVEGFTLPALHAFRRHLEARPAAPGGHFAGLRMAPSTVNGHVRRMKTFCRFMTAVGYFRFNFCAMGASDLPLLPSIPAETQLVRLVTADQLQRLVDHLLAATDPLASRDLALPLTAWVTGLRNGDLRQLTVDGLSLAARRCKVYGSKGCRDQEVAIDALAIPALADYLALARPHLARRLTLAGRSDPGWLFLSDAAGTGRNDDGLLSQYAIGQLLTRRWNAAGMPGYFGAHRSAPWPGQLHARGRRQPRYGGALAWGTPAPRSPAATCTWLARCRCARWRRCWRARSGSPLPSGGDRAAMGGRPLRCVARTPSRS